ncbi:MAG: hypothetical protein Kow0068_00920 [Marinilabiliales bacterium]
MYKQNQINNNLKMKLMKKTGLITLAIIVITMLGTINTSFAQNNGKGDCMHHGQDMKCKGMNMDKGMCNIPDLTDEQKDKIEELKINHQKEMIQLRSQIAEKKAHKKTLMTADKPDMNEINKTIDEIGALNVTIMKKEAEHIQAVRALLNDEQRVYFDMHHCYGKKHGMEHGMKGKMDHKCMH